MLTIRWRVVELKRSKLHPTSLILAIVTMSTTELNPFLEYVPNGDSVGAIMGIFLWREMKRAECYEKLYDQERINRQAAEAKCNTFPFVRQANEEFIERCTITGGAQMID